MEQKTKRRLIVLGIAAAILIPFCTFQNEHIVVTEYDYSSPKVQPGLDGCRIVQISDLHNKSFGIKSKRLLKRIRKQEPDFIFLTGDIIDGNRKGFDNAYTFLEGVAEIAPCYYVTGNHEISLTGDELKGLLGHAEDCGIQVLRSSSVTAEYNGCSFSIIGLRDEDLTDEPLKDIKPDTSQLNLVLAHEPQFIADYAAGGADLTFSGHAHGGQFRLPFTDIGFVAPDQGFFPKYTSGVHRQNGSSLAISRGLGNSVIPLRLFNCPEIVVVTLRSN